MSRSAKRHYFLWMTSLHVFHDQFLENCWTGFLLQSKDSRPLKSVCSYLLLSRKFCLFNLVEAFVIVPVLPTLAKCIHRTGFVYTKSWMTTTACCIHLEFSMVKTAICANLCRQFRWKVEAWCWTVLPLHYPYPKTFEKLACTFIPQCDLTSRMTFF